MNRTSSPVLMAADDGLQAQPPRPRGRPPLSADFQRERILSAATDIFIARGFSAGSVDAVGRAAGVTKRTIYELVGDKEALFHAVCNRLCTTATTFHFDVAITDLPVQDVLVEMATTLIEMSLAPQAIAFSRMLVVEAHRFPELVLSVMDEARSEMHMAIANVFAGLIARKRIKQVDPSQAADTFYDAIVGSRAMRAVLGYNEPSPPIAEIETRVNMILHGYLT